MGLVVDHGVEWWFSVAICCRIPIQVGIDHRPALVGVERTIFGYHGGDDGGWSRPKQSGEISFVRKGLADLVADGRLDEAPDLKGVNRRPILALTHF
jgi:hypothetical protein